MAYGMRPEELAAVGQNVNEQGGAVTESSIQEAMDAELDAERAEAVARNKARQNKARIADAETKASIKQRGMDALKTIAVEGLTLGATSMKGKGQPKPGGGTAELVATTDPHDLGARTPGLQLASPSARQAPGIGTEAYATAKEKEYEDLLKAYGRPGNLYSPNRI